MRQLKLVNRMRYTSAILVLNLEARPLLRNIFTTCLINIYFLFRSVLDAGYYGRNVGYRSGHLVRRKEDGRSLLPSVPVSYCKLHHIHDVLPSVPFACT